MQLFNLLVNIIKLLKGNLFIVWNVFIVKPLEANNQVIQAILIQISLFLTIILIFIHIASQVINFKA
jgi:hypothetical protein